MTSLRLTVAHEVDSGEDLEDNVSVYLRMGLSTAVHLVLC